VRAFEKGESPKMADESGMDDFAKQLLSRAPGGVPTNFYRAAIEDTTIITMKGVRNFLIPVSARPSHAVLSMRRL
jgi:hypothetical protein